MADFQEMVNSFELEMDRTQLKSMFNDFGSTSSDYTDHPEDSINHQMTLADFLSIFLSSDSSKPPTNPSASTENVRLFSRSVPKDSDLTLSTVKRILKHELDMQRKVNQLRCQLKQKADFLTILKAMGYSTTSQFISKRRLRGTRD